MLVFYIYIESKIRFVATHKRKQTILCNTNKKRIKKPFCRSGLYNNGYVYTFICTGYTVKASNRTIANFLWIMLPKQKNKLFLNTETNQWQSALWRLDRKQNSKIVAKNENDSRITVNSPSNENEQRKIIILLPKNKLTRDKIIACFGFQFNWTALRR